MNNILYGKAVLIGLTLSLTFAATAAPTMAPFSEMNGLVSLDFCSGAILNVGRKDSEPALVISAGHCVNSSILLSPNGAIRNHPYLRSGVRIFGPESAYYIPGGLKVVFATMDGIDLSLLELPISNGFLKEQGIRSFRVGSSPLKKGMPVKMQAANWVEQAQCAVEGMANMVVEGHFSFPQTWYLSNACQKVAAGFSGSPVFNDDREIVGIVFTTNTGVSPDPVDDELEVLGKPCSIANPCEKDHPDTQPVTFINRVYMQSVAKWKNCIDSGFTGHSCLPDRESNNHRPALPSTDEKNLEIPFSHLLRENEFIEVTKKVTAIYEPIASMHQKNMMVFPIWRETAIEKTRQVGSTNWKIEVAGAIARHPAITRDAFALILCHEIGHQLGGYPFKLDNWEPDTVVHTESAEAQSDYFATQSCIRQIWQNEIEENASFRQKTSPWVQVKCDLVWNKEEDQNLCYRTLTAIDSMASFFTSYHRLEKNPVRLNTSDRSVARWSILEEGEYPSAQCRVDTLVAGALCTKPFNIGLKPGLKQAKAKDNLAAERDAERYSCFAESGHPLGARPLCWYLPKNKSF